MITIIDYGLGNLASIKNMLKKIGHPSEVTSDKFKIEQATKLILPGVGSFERGMDNLRAAGMIDTLNEKVVKNKTPLLGICLGMQLLTNHSEEGNADGLKWIDAETKRFNFEAIQSNNNLKIPHMGWTEIKTTQHKLFQNLSPSPRYYFVHSYAVACNNKNHSIATANYGYNFDCAIAIENIMGVQFHPEKSHRFGMEILNNFALNF